jgi:hypothetical protein
MKKIADTAGAPMLRPAPPVAKLPVGLGGSSPPIDPGFFTNHCSKSLKSPLNLRENQHLHCFSPRLSSILHPPLSAARIRRWSSPPRPHAAGIRSGETSGPVVGIKPRRCSKRHRSFAAGCGLAPRGDRRGPPPSGIRPK